MTSLFLAGKIEEHHLKMRDVINVCHRLVTSVYQMSDMRLYTAPPITPPQTLPHHKLSDPNDDMKYKKS